MKKNASRFLTILTVFLWTNSLAQTPTLMNYPFVKGYYKSAHKDSTTLFCLTDYGLMNWDITNLNAPTLISKLPAPGIYFRGEIKANSDYLFIHRFDTLIVIDKSDLTNPTYVPFNLPNNSVSAIDVRDTLLYSTSFGGNELSVFDISDINNPALIASLPLPYVENVSVFDNFLYAYNYNTFYRLDISTAIPTVSDSIIIPLNHVILSAKANTQMAAIALGDEANFLEPAGIFVYDFSSIGSPALIDSTAISTSSFNTLLAITDSLLYINSYSTSGNIKAYDITNLSDITLTDSFGFSDPANELLVDDNLLFTMCGSEGFEIHQKSAPFTHAFVDTIRVGEWLTNLQVSSTGFVFSSGKDSVYVFNKGRTTSETFADYTWITQANEIQVVDSFLLESQVGGANAMRLSSISNLPSIDSLSTFFNQGSSFLPYFNIWGQKLYNRNSPTGTEIHDISDPSSPVLLANNLSVAYDGFYDNVLYDFDGSLSYIDLYDASTNPPQLIQQVYSPVPDCGVGAAAPWDPQRPMRHFLGVNTGGCYFQLDLSDTSNIHYTSTKPMTGMNGSSVGLAMFRDSILYLPGVYGYNLHIYDVCDIDHFRKISVFELNRFVQSIVLVDSVLFISFGGYIESYDISNIVPCLILSTQERMKQRDTFTIFPNPSRGSFTIQYHPFDQDLTLTVSNTLGQKIIQRKLPASQNQMTSIDLVTNTPPGLYLVTLTGRNQSLTKKLIIE